MTVASMPIWSAFVRSMFSLVLPRQKFPPPITTPTWTPLFTTCAICAAAFLTVASSKPCFLSPARASPLSFSNILRIMSSLSFLVPPAASLI